MRYALMERWNDCTHTFVFGFGEMTLTPVDYAAITGLRFTGPDPPLDARYQTATLGAQPVWSYEYCIYPGGPSGDSPVESRRIPRYLAHCHHTYASGEDPEYWRNFLNDRELSNAEVERLRTKLEVEGIPLDSSEEDEDALLQMRRHRLHLLRLLLVLAVGGSNPAAHLNHF
ncbi:hypothetical protein JCGZ_18186 [Jatropha curcas]|uniref:Aminotransferase-like plant mobile domain-containing protein n=1 Tax=Jatropha curcas TaxID=180498 RepID=A0A067K2L0_JATCU|nr:hypothetical protein JCGZ_18186 [Jatropha curcas]